MSGLTEQVHAAGGTKIKNTTMSKIDRSRWYHKLHQLQKRLMRAEENEGHSKDKAAKRKGQLKRLLDKVRMRDDE